MGNLHVPYCMCSALLPPGSTAPQEQERDVTEGRENLEFTATAARGEVVSCQPPAGPDATGMPPWTTLPTAIPASTHSTQIQLHFSMLFPPPLSNSDHTSEALIAWEKEAGPTYQGEKESREIMRQVFVDFQYPNDARRFLTSLLWMPMGSGHQGAFKEPSSCPSPP